MGAVSLKSIDEEGMRKVAEDLAERFKPAWYQRPFGLIALSTLSGALGGLVVLVVDRLAP